MKGKKFIIAAAVLAAALAVIFIMKPFLSAPAPKKAAKKTFAKGMGGITVKIKSSKDKKQSVRVRAFRSEGKETGVYITSFISDRMQEMLPGTYDIEVDTVPQTIYKNIKVSESRETVKDIGTATGSILIKALNSKKKEAPIAARIMYPRSNFQAAVVIANRQAEIVPGAYDIKIETVPPQTKSNFKIDPGKESVLDLGVVSGALIVKAVDEDKKEVRLGVRVKDAGKNTAIASTITNNAVEIAQGIYDVDVMSAPIQSRKAVKITAGEETVVEVTVQAKPAQPQAVPAKRR